MSENQNHNGESIARKKVDQNYGNIERLLESNLKYNVNSTRGDYDMQGQFAYHSDLDPQIKTIKTNITRKKENQIDIKEELNILQEAKSIIEKDMQDSSAKQEQFLKMPKPSDPNMYRRATAMLRMTTPAYKAINEYNLTLATDTHYIEMLTSLMQKVEKQIPIYEEILSEKEPSEEVQSNDVYTNTNEIVGGRKRRTRRRRKSNKKFRKSRAKASRRKQ